MIKLNEKSLFSLGLLFFAIVMLVSTIGMREDVVLIPRIMGTFLLVFTAIQFIIDAFPSLRKEVSKKSESADTETSDKKDNVDKGKLRETYLFIGWMVLFLILIYFIQMIGAIIVALLIYLRWQKESWKLSIIYAGGLGLAIYLIFVVGMKIHYFL